MLSDQERRVLQELEAAFAGDAVEPDRSACTRAPASRRAHGASLAGTLRSAAAGLAGVLWFGLLLSGGWTAAVAVGLVGVLCWLTWRAWPRLTGSVRVPATPRRSRGPRGDRRLQLSRHDWLRRHLERLAEGE
jgi:hypothetical protein